MFEWQVETVKRINLIYDDVERHCIVIANFTASMARRYVCEACKCYRTSDVTHACDQNSSDHMTGPPCAFSHVLCPFAECNRHFRSRTCFANYKQCTSKEKSVYERKRFCATCRWIVTHDNHECNKRLCDNCKQINEIGHLCYMRPLKDTLPTHVIRYCTHSTISKQPKILGTLTLLSCTYPNSSACNSCVRDAKARKTEQTACFAAGGSTPSGKLPWGKLFHM